MKALTSLFLPLILLTGCNTMIEQSKNWVPVSMGLSNNVVNSIGVFGDSIYVGTTNTMNNRFIDGRISVSTNGGKNWAVGNGLDNVIVTSFGRNGNTIFAGTMSGMYLSTNEGHDWKLSMTGLPANIHVYSIAANDGKVFAMTDSSVFVSNNSGLSWVNANKGLPVIEYDVGSLLLKGDILLAGTWNDDGGKIYRSTDYGVSWTMSNTGLPNNSPILSMAANGKNIFVSAGDGVYISADNGVSWSPANKGFPSYIRVNSIVVKGDTVYAGTYGNGIYVSTNNAGSWTPAGLSNETVFCLGLNHNAIFAGTSGKGIFLESF